MIIEKLTDDCGIYEIYCCLNNKGYIGSTSKSFRRRASQHIHLLIHNKHHSKKLQNSWNKYGQDNFEFRILEIIEKDEVKIREREQYWLDKKLPYKYGLNMAQSSEGPVGVKREGGELAYQAKLKNKDIAKIKERYENGESTTKLAEEFLVSGPIISNALNGKTYKNSGITPIKLRNKSHGESSNTAKMTEEKVLELISLYNAGASAKELASIFSIAVPTARNIATGISWRHLKIDRKNFSFEKDRFKEHKRKSMLTSSQLLEIDTLIKEKSKTQREIAKDFNVCEQTIYCIKARKGIYKSKFEKLIGNN